jgi:predicted alpha/beta-fold hydrolase
MAKGKLKTKAKSTKVRNRLIVKNLVSACFKMTWMIWPTAIEKLALRLFFSPADYKLNHSEKTLLNQGKPFQISVRDKTVRCWQWGEGPIVILAHGWNGRGIQFQPLIAALLKANYSVITFDATGHGASEGKTSNYFEFSDTLRTLWHSIEKHRVQAVIGHSLGACALLNFISKESYHKVAILIAPALKLREMLFYTFESHGVPKIVYLNLVQNLEMRHQYSVFSDNPSQLIKKVKNDVLIFHDEKDKAVPFTDTEHVAEMYDHIVLRATTGLGHKRILSDKSVIDEIVRTICGKKTTKIQKAS